MVKKWNTIIKILLLLLIGVLACVPALYQPSSDLAKKSGHTLEELQHGRQLYIDHCGSCHLLYLPKEYSDKDWEKILDSMKTRSKISESEKQLIWNFLLTGK